MTDRQAVMMALLAAGGALLPSRAPLFVAALAVVAAYLLRRPLVLALAVAVLCSSLAHRSWEGIEQRRSGPVVGAGMLVTDPVETGAATTAVLRVGGVRYLAAGWGAAGARLGHADAGDKVQVEGSARAYRGPAERKAALHVGARLSLTSVRVSGPSNPLFFVANEVRHRIADGASSLSRERRALFTGLVYGDDRGQSPLTEADFRFAGLTHLLAVSGQNVAYVLTLAGPLIRRCTLRGRLVATLTLLLLFATVTRFEPSVLRATFMAGLAVAGRWMGREVSAGRLLALAVTLLLVIDPLLATSIAFRLSVAASAGIVWLQPFVVRNLRGPATLIDAVGVTISAQLAVAPVLLASFGPISLVSVPANVLAGPVAGLAMSWGMTAGFAAGFVPPTWAGGVHSVTSGMLWMLESIAAVAAQVPLAPVGFRWLALACTLAVIPARVLQTRTRRTLYAALTCCLLLALVPLPMEGRYATGPNSEVISHEGSTVLVLRDPSATTWILDDLRSRGIRDLDVIVTSPASGQAATEIARRLPTGAFVMGQEQQQAVSAGAISGIASLTDGRLEFHLRGTNEPSE